MNTSTTAFSRIGQAALEDAARAARISMDGAERAFNMQLGYAKSALETAGRNARAVAQVKDAQELFALRARIAEAAIANLMGYSRSLYEVASETQTEYSRLAEQRMARFQQAVTESIDEAARSAPAGGDVAIAAVKSQLAATTAAFDSFTKAARNLASYADAGVGASRPARSRK